MTKLLVVLLLMLSVLSVSSVGTSVISMMLLCCSSSLTSLFLLSLLVDKKMFDEARQRTSTTATQISGFDFMHDMTSRDGGGMFLVSVVRRGQSSKVNKVK